MILHIKLRGSKKTEPGDYSYCGKVFTWDRFAYQKETPNIGWRLCKTCVKSKQYWDKIMEETQ
jgi:hypothetical protein